MTVVTMRRQLIAANWKMNTAGDDAAELASEVRALVDDLCDSRDIVICPPFTVIDRVRTALAGSCIALGAQNMHWEEAGAYTGEVSAKMLLTSACTYAILGHSERRQLFAESDEAVNKKLRAALRSGLAPIVCIGETLAQRESDQTEAVVLGQLRAALHHVPPDDVARIAIAYEPVWAIGTGRTASPDEADHVHRLIRDDIRVTCGEAAASAARILYGGSVKPDNAADLFARPEIDGGLIGGASLQAESFGAVVRSAG